MPMTAPNDLEPEWVGEPTQELVPAIFEDDCFGDHGAKPRHPLCQPVRNAAAVKRQVRASRPARHQFTATGLGSVRGSMTRRTTQTSSAYTSPRTEREPPSPNAWITGLVQAVAPAWRA